MLPLTLPVTRTPRALAWTTVWSLCAFASVAAQQGATITVHAPHAQQYELALDEIELHPEPGRSLPAAASLSAAGVGTVARRDSTSARFTLTPAASADAVLQHARNLEAANPGTVAQLVLYEPGRDRSEATRHLLTREVAVILENAGVAAAFLAEYAAREPRPIEAVPNAYMLIAEDPLSALTLADALRLRAGVTTAYPLLRRRLFAQ